jgi:DNA (cytosine-5)-methyltransferase 1
LLENVDRLLKSPAKQRGRDFGIMLACFAELGYSVEWRVVNAALYGAAQRRRRVFVFAYSNKTKYGNKMKFITAEDIIKSQGLMAKAFPITDAEGFKKITVGTDIAEISDKFFFDFENAGCMVGGEITTVKVKEKEEGCITLGEILQNEGDEKYFIPTDKIDKWSYLKGAKKIERTAANGHKYTFSEGAIAFPDPWDRPSRTMLTSEATLNRSSHAVVDRKTGKLRLLTPIEAERLQGFDDNWTNTGMSERMRYFCMGNALVVPMITRMGKILDDIISLE